MSATKKPEGKRTRVNLINDVSFLMCRSLPNVKVTYEAAVRPMVHPVMMGILFNAALEKRDWSFNITNVGKFDIYLGSEELASVELGWSRRAGLYIPHLTADRLPTTRGRSGAYSHKEAAPILRKIREFVYPRTLEETMAGHTGNVASALNSLKYRAEGMVENCKEALTTAALAFALDPMVKAQFLQYEATVGASAKRDTAQAMRDQEQAAERVVALDDLRKGQGAAHALAVLAGNDWFIKHAGAIHRYHADELPEQFLNVQVMKLVEKDTVLPGVGVKLSDKHYIVTVSN